MSDELFSQISDPVVRQEEALDIKRMDDSNNGKDKDKNEYDNYLINQTKQSWDQERALYQKLIKNLQEVIFLISDVFYNFLILINEIEI